MADIKQTYGARLKRLRLSAHLTQARLGLMVGLSARYISDLENGRRNPTLTCLDKIASGLDLTLSEMLDGIESPR